MPTGGCGGPQPPVGKQLAKSSGLRSRFESVFAIRHAPLEGGAVARHPLVRGVVHAEIGRQDPLEPAAVLATEGLLLRCVLKVLGLAFGTGGRVTQGGRAHRRRRAWRTDVR